VGGRWWGGVEDGADIRKVTGGLSVKRQVED